ncbi:MAG: ATP-grasp domain-containing protein [Myxococcota bacterium]
MTDYDVTLVTCDPLPEPDPDMQPLRDALDELGLSSRVCVWNASNVDWSRSPVTLIRSTWDYYHNRDNYLRWANHVAEVSTLYNEPELVAWNSHKSYLLDLESRGIQIVPTVLLRSGSSARLQEICERHEWDKVVVKPAVSAASFQTHVVDVAHLDEQLFASLLARRDMLVQPYIPEVESAGEHSIIAIDGELSHAVRKSPRFHGEDESISGPIDITADQATLAENALTAVDSDLVYGRVDMVETDADGPMLTELELIEPSLFLDFAPEAPRRLARSIATRLNAARAARDKSSENTTPAPG